MTADRRQLFKGLGLTLAIAAIWALQQHLTAIPLPLFFVGATLAIVLTIVCTVAAAVSCRGARWSTSALLLALAATVFCRLRYLWTVPSGFNFEPLAFLFFARRLVNEGFPYIPYSWYAHTLYSYWIALVLLLFRSDVVAYRVAIAAMSILTVIVLCVCADRLFGRRVAWIVTGLIAASWWHLWASRNGYHQQLMPLIQAMYLYGVVVGFSDDPWRGFAIAAASTVLALHAYWGLYLLAPLSICVAVYALIWERDGWRRGRTALAVMVVAALLCLIPLARFLTSELQIFEYVRKAVDQPTAYTTSVA
ncbi:MAG TPA: glycosyltransferase family 39 protein, partial [Candidatus Acidoferrales bacterium]|nr:glycosyltransferase family 39 protein [Candidatus Acidoferrales bacterium]